MFSFVSRGKDFPEISSGLLLTTSPELGPLSKPGPKGNRLTMTGLGLLAIMANTTTETKRGVSRQGKIATDSSYMPLVLNYSSSNWLSYLNSFDLT